MGEVYRSEDLIRRRGEAVPDLTPKPIPQPITPHSLEEIVWDIEWIKFELTKIKITLKTHGIAVE